MNTMDELKKALAEVSDTYDDFVRGIPVILKRDVENQKKLLDFIKSNKSATTSEVLAHLDKLQGLI